jgi:hypothetical protein
MATSRAVTTALAVWSIMAASGCGPDDGRGVQRRAIQLCWEDQAKKSNTPEVARFIAGACEKMERDFRAKYNASP